MSLRATLHLLRCRIGGIVGEASAAGLPQNPVVPAQDQFPLFDDAPEAATQPATPKAAVPALAEALNARFAVRWHLGTSSWHLPGWAGQVWHRPWPAERLSREMLA
jgi:hypothetical protein